MTKKKPSVQRIFYDELPAIMVNGKPMKLDEPKQEAQIDTDKARRALRRLLDDSHETTQDT